MAAARGQIHARAARLGSGNRVSGGLLSRDSNDAAIAVCHTLEGWKVSGRCGSVVELAALLAVLAC